MNVLKKIPFIVIFLFVIVSHVQSEIVKRADDSQCTSLGGNCMNPNNCTGTVKAGLCPGGNDNKCCIPKTTPSVEGVGSQCTHNNISGTCIDTSKNNCGTTLVTGKCPGPVNVKCCLSKKITDTTPSTNTSNNGVGSKCTHNNISGTCIDTSKSNCGTTLVSGKCPGPANVKCCLTKKITDSTPSTNTSNNGVGSKCTHNNISGTCIDTSKSNCGTTLVSGKCPGPANVKCCLSKKITDSTPSTNTSNNGVGSKCTHNNISGTCIDSSKSNCGTTLVSGKCPGPANVKCCLTKKITDTTNTSNNGVGSKCSYNNISGTCIDSSKNKCGTTLVTGKCPGPANVKCCLSKKITTSTNTSNNGVGSKCSYNNISGTCINTNSDKCSTTLVTNRCAGPANVKCCLTKKITTSTNTSNNGVGSKCSYNNISGTCINTNSDKCSTTLVTNRCAGPSNVKCCLTKKITTSTNTSNNGVGAKCSYNNISGTCINTNSDKCSTTLVTNRCAGPANIKCCLTRKITTTVSNNVPGTSITKFEQVTRIYLYMKYKLQNEYYEKYKIPFYFTGVQNDMFKKALDKSESMKNGKAYVIKFTITTSTIYGMTQAWVKQISIYQSNKNDKIYSNSTIRGRSVISQSVDAQGKGTMSGVSYYPNDSISLSTIKKINEKISSLDSFAALNEGNVSIPTEGVFHDSNINGLSFNIDTASIGGFFLNMKKDDHGVYHAAFDCWQRIGGYIDLYDLVFDYFTEMARNKVEFTYDGKGFVLWAWKGDYINLGAGTELGLYYRNGLLNTFDLDLYGVDKDRYYMPMKVKLMMNHGIIVNYSNDKNWWMTAFNPNYLNVKASQLVSEFTVNFDIGKGSKYYSEEFSKGMYKAFCNHIKSKKQGDETKWSCIGDENNRIAVLKF